MSNLTRTQIYIPQDILQRAKIKAKSIGVKNLSQYIRDLLEESLKNSSSSKPKLRITKLASSKIVDISKNHNIIYDYKL
ncbi:MAG: hypothetical protein WCK98_05045 [bacterium]